MSERVLLAGCGDLGLRTARLLRARGDEVWALRRSAVAGAGDGIHWLRGDLARPGGLRQLPRGITQLVYLPAPGRGRADKGGLALTAPRQNPPDETGFDRSRPEPGRPDQDARERGMPGTRVEASYRSLFVDGLCHLLAALEGASLRRVLFVSSSAVYGEHAGAWVDEATPTAPLGGNGKVLLEAEHWLARQPVASVVLRLAGLYGPGRVQLFERLRSGEARVPRTATHWSNRIHVDDAAAAVAHLLALREPLPLYLGADDTPLPLDVLYDALALRLGVPPPPAGAAPAGIGSKRLSNARLRASGFAPQWPDARAGYAALLDN